MDLRALEKELEKSPEDPNLHYKHGLLLAEAGEGGRAARSWRRALEIKPDHTRALNLLGTTYLSQNRLGEAEQLYRSALERKPDQPQILNARALALSRNGSHEEAISL
ncbi:MAG TPA: tetratricopeptide repeat protein, partial [Phycisphaerales bacterium]|nr:tetratricopeptide repeat protein [Phycisphaerales bacterium]